MAHNEAYDQSVIVGPEMKATVPVLTIVIKPFIHCGLFLMLAMASLLTHPLSVMEEGWDGWSWMET